jgi:oxygen-independent coproporphyrinogen-3 oxidase
VRAGLYVHFPFCRAKCPYCHFYSLADRDDLYFEWWEGLKREADLVARDKFEIDTVYIGGGTPSLLQPDDLHAIRELLNACFYLRAGEWTLEANPGVEDGALARGWREAGVTRLSIGIQTFDDAVLKTLGRLYSAAEAREFYSLCRESGFESIGIDIMTGIPGETSESAEKTAAEALRLAPDHVSLYILENVEGLPFERVLEDNPVNEDAVADHYRMFQARLESAGLRQYEISNFARPGRESRHNLKYWRYEHFLGLGPSACSHIGARRWSNLRTIGAWSDALRRGAPLHEELVELAPETSAKEALVFGLRLVEGVDLGALRERFGVDLAATFSAEIDELVGDGWLVRDGGTIRIPPDRFLVSNHVFSKFVQA